MSNLISNEDEKLRVLQNEELDVVTGGIMIIGGTETLGGPDTSPLRYFGQYIGNPDVRTF